MKAEQHLDFALEGRSSHHDGPEAGILPPAPLDAKFRAGA
jgi:hypothetical protein